VPCKVCGDETKYFVEVNGRMVELCGPDGQAVSARSPEGLARLESHGKGVDRLAETRELIEELPPAGEPVPMWREDEHVTRAPQPTHLVKDPQLAKAERDFLAGRMDGTPSAAGKWERERDSPAMEREVPLEEPEHEEPEELEPWRKFPPEPPEPQLELG